MYMEEDFEGYDVAQICLNGHIVNDSYTQLPQHNSPYCGKCGEPTINQCPSCHKDIRGAIWTEIGSSFDRASYCLNCGKPYPWTDRASKAAKELAQEQGLEPTDKEMLVESINDIMSDSPRTALGVTRFKKIMRKIGRDGEELFKQILAGVISAGANKMIWGK
jgi:hypothetical protein